MQFIFLMLRIRIYNAKIDVKSLMRNLGLNNQAKICIIGILQYI